MNQQQFARSWNQMKQYLPARWVKVTAEDVERIDGDQEGFKAVVAGHYGVRQDEVHAWAHRWYCHWSGQYAGYEAVSASSSKS
jgi:hypothetical protein